MQKQIDNYFYEKNIDKLNKVGYTNFLDGKELNTLKKILNKMHIDYNIYEPFADSDYKCIYTKLPEVTCFEIITYDELKHQDIMGALYNFNIDEQYIGDIIIDKKYYFIIMSEMKDYFMNNFNLIGRSTVKLKETNIPIVERKYIDYEYIVSSNRIDNVIAKITNLNRDAVTELISKKQVILNYDVLTNKSYLLKDNDTFSIRRYGKYKYMGVLKNTKKDNLVVGIKKYN